jgi:hypothetical protein
MISSVSMNDKPVVPPQVAVPASGALAVATKAVSPAAVAAAKAVVAPAVPKKAMGVFGLLLLAGVAYAATR